MPPRNPTRSLLTEQALRDRVAYERERRGWTLEGLAKRLTDAGCPINQSAIYKIEKGDPPRRITVDELVGFSQVFDIPVDQLLLPPELANTHQIAELVAEWNKTARAAADAQAAADEAWAALKSHVDAHPELADALEKIMTVWAEYTSAPEDRALRRDVALAQLTPDPERREAYTAAVQASLGEHRG